MRIAPLIATALLTGIGSWAFTYALLKSDSDRPQVELRPIAEFEPTFGVALSDQILTKSHGIGLIQALLSAKARIYLLVDDDRAPLTEAILKENKLDSPQDGVTRIQLEHEALWLRDFMPIPILEKIPGIPPSPSFVDFVYRDGNTLDDAAIHQFGLAINSSVRHLPIVLDGGNFMSNGETCILSEEFSEDPEALLADQPFELKPGSLPSIFRTALGCRDTILVDPTPHPHVDMWMKFVDRKTLLVNQLDPALIEASTGLEGYDRERSKRISKALDEAAKKLAKHFKVVRIPMLPPHGDAYITYANAVLINGKAIIPRYREGFMGDPKKGEEIFSKYEQQVAKSYQDFGLDVIFVEGDELIHDGGAFHCVTFHLPDLEAIAKGKAIAPIKPS